MTPTTDPAAAAPALPPALVEQVLKLTPDELDELIGLALDHRSGPAGAPAAVAGAWKDEIARRCREVVDGTADLVDAKTALAESRRRLRERYGV